MAKKEKKISITKWESLKVPNVVTVPLDGVEDVEITIKRTLSLEETMQFIENVVSSVVDVEDGTYVPEITEFVKCSCILTMYANFTMPSNVEKQYDLIYGTDAVDQVLKHVNRRQFYEIEEAIEQRIKHGLHLIENTASASVNKMIQKIEEFSARSEEMFGNVNGGDMAGFIQNLSKLDGVNERELVRAVFDEQNRDGDVPMRVVKTAE